VIPGGAGGDNSSGGAMLDAGVETHGSTGGAVSEKKKNQKQNYMH